MSERQSVGGFAGFAIRIDVLGQGAFYAFTKMRAAAMLTLAAINKVVAATWEFEKSLAELTRIVAINTEDTMALTNNMSLLNDTILGLARDSVYGINEIAKAFTYAARAGKSTAASIDLVTRSLLLASAVGGELNEMVRTVNRLTNMWRVAGTDISEVIVDQLVASEALFAMSTEEMMVSLNMAGAVAAESGLSFAQTATMLGLMYDAGINASTAGTTLRRAIQQLVDPTARTIDAVELLGISWNYLNSLPIDQKLAVVAEKLLQVEDNTLRMDLAFDIFGSRGSNIIPLLEDMGGRFYELVDAIDESTGAAERSAEAFGNTLYGRFLQLKNTIEATIVAIGQFSMDAGGLMTIGVTAAGGIWAMTKALQFFVSIAMSEGIGAIFMLSTYLGKLSLAQFLAVSTASKLSTSLKWVWFSMKSVVSATWGAITAAYSWVASQFAALSVAKLMKIQTYKNIAGTILSTTWTIIKTIATGAWTVATWLANAALTVMNVLLSPLTLILVLLVGLFIMLAKNIREGGAAAGYFGEIWGTIKEVFSAIWETVKALFDVLFLIAMVIFAPIIAAVKFLFMLLRPVFLVIKLVAFFIKGIMMVVRAIVKWVFEWFKKLKFVQKIVAGIKKVWDGIVAAVRWAFEWIAKIINAILKFFGSDKRIVVEKKDSTKDDDSSDDDDDTDVEDEEDDGIPEGDYEAPDTGGDEPVGSRGSGAGSAGINIAIYIEAGIADIMDEENFAAAIVAEIMEEIRRNSGTYI